MRSNITIGAPPKKPQSKKQACGDDFSRYTENSLQIIQKQKIGNRKNQGKYKSLERIDDRNSSDGKVMTIRFLEKQDKMINHGNRFGERFNGNLADCSGMIKFEESSNIEDIETDVLYENVNNMYKFNLIKENQLNLDKTKLKLKHYEQYAESNYAKQENLEQGKIFREMDKKALADEKQKIANHDVSVPLKSPSGETNESKSKETLMKNMMSTNPQRKSVWNLINFDQIRKIRNTKKDNGIQEIQQDTSKNYEKTYGVPTEKSSRVLKGKYNFCRIISEKCKHLKNEEEQDSDTRLKRPGKIYIVKPSSNNSLQFCVNNKQINYRTPSPNKQSISSQNSGSSSKKSEKQSDYQSPTHMSPTSRWHYPYDQDRNSKKNCHGPFSESPNRDSVSSTKKSDKKLSKIANKEAKKPNQKKLLVTNKNDLHKHKFYQSVKEKNDLKDKKEFKKELNVIEKQIDFKKYRKKCSLDGEDIIPYNTNDYLQSKKARQRSHSLKTQGMSIYMNPNNPKNNVDFHMVKYYNEDPSKQSKNKNLSGKLHEKQVPSSRISSKRNSSLIYLERRKNEQSAINYKQIL